MLNNNVLLNKQCWYFRILNLSLHSQSIPPQTTCHNCVFTLLTPQSHPSSEELIAHFMAKVMSSNVNSSCIFSSAYFMRVITILSYWKEKSVFILGHHPKPKPQSSYFFYPLCLFRCIETLTHWPPRSYQELLKSSSFLMFSVSHPMCSPLGCIMPSCDLDVLLCR